MNITSIGDLAVSYQTRRDVGLVKAKLAQATSELSSGVVSDISAHLRGDFGKLGAVENDLRRMDTYREVATEQRLVISALQGTLEQVRTLAGVSDTLLTFPEGDTGPSGRSVGEEALSAFNATLRALNVQAGGRTIFAGIASDATAVAVPEVILEALEAEISAASATTAPDIEMIVDDWFNTPIGFEALGYLGSSASDVDLRVSDTETLSLNLTANSPEIKETLAALSLSALVGRGLLANDLSERGALLRQSGLRLVGANDQLITLQAKVGTAEATLERATAEVSAQKDGLTLLRSDLIEADSYEAAISLQNAETQLQSIYTITARLSQLSLVRFL